MDQPSSHSKLFWDLPDQWLDQLDAEEETYSQIFEEEEQEEEQQLPTKAIDRNEVHFFRKEDCPQFTENLLTCKPLICEKPERQLVEMEEDPCEYSAKMVAEDNLIIILPLAEKTLISSDPKSSLGETHPSSSEKLEEPSSLTVGSSTILETFEDSEQQSMQQLKEKINCQNQESLSKTPSLDGFSQKIEGQTRQNIYKGVMNGFRRFLCEQKTAVIEKFRFKESKWRSLVDFLKTRTFNHQNLKYIALHQEFSQVFADFLSKHAERWLQLSRVANKPAAISVIQHLETCIQNKPLLDEFFVCYKSHRFPRKNFSFQIKEAQKRTSGRNHQPHRDLHHDPDQDNINTHVV